MEKKIESQTYSYKDVAVGSGFNVEANKVIIKDNRVTTVENAVAVSESQGTFNFSIYDHGLNGRRTLSISSAQEGVDAQGIAWEFVKMVESDLCLSSQEAAAV